MTTLDKWMAILAGSLLLLTCMSAARSLHNQAITFRARYRQSIGSDTVEPTEGGHMVDRYWDGKTVHLARTNPEHDRRHYELALTDSAIRSLALMLMRLKQTTLSLPPEVQEVLDALNYVTVADPASVAAHNRMEAGKGMTPDGGHKRGSEWRDRLPDTGERYQ